MATSDVWEQAKKILQSRLDRFSYVFLFRSTFLAEDEGKVIVVDVDGAKTVSALARKHQPDILNALAAVGRPKTTVRLRTDLANGGDDPDWYVREVVPPIKDKKVGTKSLKRRA